MERSLFTLMSNGFLGAAAFGVAALGFNWAGPGDPPPGKNDGNWRLLDPITYENLTVFPVVSTASYDTREFLTLVFGNLFFRIRIGVARGKHRRGAVRLLFLFPRLAEFIAGHA